MGPIEEQVEAELLCLSARMYALFRRRGQAEFADDLSALTVDIEHWQQKNTVVVCGDFNARMPRCRVPYQLSSPSVQRSRDAQGATLVDP
jgi:endonuclease/exonuclease/phosphatase family metal-dependent hydrolase